LKPSVLLAAIISKKKLRGQGADVFGVVVSCADEVEVVVDSCVDEVGVIDSCADEFGVIGSWSKEIRINNKTD